MHSFSFETWRFALTVLIFLWRSHTAYQIHSKPFCVMSLMRYETILDLKKIGSWARLLALFNCSSAEAKTVLTTQADRLIYSIFFICLPLEFYHIFQVFALGLYCYSCLMLNLPLAFIFIVGSLHIDYFELYLNRLTEIFNCLCFEKLIFLKLHWIAESLSIFFL